ncbi:MAG: CAP domain-containing protein, partial [Alphaproteobacteria bacterium]|nr:CAP domain-containing protein [Alphaproteobacteria bacterium]
MQKMTRWNLAILTSAVLAFGLWASTARSYPLPPDVVPPFSSAEAVKEINRYRALAKLAPWVHNDRLEQSASLHSRYLVENLGCSISHNESNTNSPFFRGASPSERIKKVMPDETYTSELVSSNQTTGKRPSDWRKRIQNLLDAPFHRTGLLGNFVKAGVALSNCSEKNSLGLQLVVNMATQSKLESEDELIVWPNDGDANAPIDWFAFESPLPLPAELYGK